MMYSEIMIGNDNITFANQADLLSHYALLLNKTFYNAQIGDTGVITDILIKRSTDRNKLLLCYRVYSCCDKYDKCFVNDFIIGDLVFVAPTGLKKHYDDLYDKYISDIKQFFGSNFRDNMIVELDEKIVMESIKRTNEFNYTTNKFEEAVCAAEETIKNILG